MKEEILDKLTEYLNKTFEDYGLVITTLIIGIVVGYFFKMLVSDRKYMKQVDKLLAEKDNRIASLNIIISERLNTLTIDKKDKGFFRQLKKFFKFKISQKNN